MSYLFDSFTQGVPSFFIPFPCVVIMLIFPIPFTSRSPSFFLSFVTNACVFLVSSVTMYLPSQIFPYPYSHDILGGALFVLAPLIFATFWLLPSSYDVPCFYLVPAVLFFFTFFLSKDHPVFHFLSSFWPCGLFSPKVRPTTRASRDQRPTQGFQSSYQR